MAKSEMVPATPDRPTRDEINLRGFHAWLRGYRDVSDHAVEQAMDRAIRAMEARWPWLREETEEGGMQ